MESFPEQLQRQQHFYRQFAKHSYAFVKSSMLYARNTLALGELFEQHARFQFYFDRPALASVAKVLTDFGTYLGSIIPKIAEVLGGFDCKDELRIMFYLYKEYQTAKPPFHVQANATFIESAAQYYVNRQKTLKTLTKHLSAFYVKYAAALLQTAADLRNAGYNLDEAAPIIDVARRCANLETGVDICQLLKITKHDFEHKDINLKVYQPQPVYQSLPASASPAKAQFVDSTAGLHKYNLKQYIRAEQPTGTKFDSVPSLIQPKHTSEDIQQFQTRDSDDINQKIALLNQKEAELYQYKQQLLIYYNTKNDIFLTNNRPIDNTVQQQTLVQPPVQTYQQVQYPISVDYQALLIYLIYMYYYYYQYQVSYPYYPIYYIQYPQYYTLIHQYLPVYYQIPAYYQQIQVPLNQSNPPAVQLPPPKQYQYQPAFKPLVDSTTLDISYDVGIHNNKVEDSFQIPNTEIKNSKPQEAPKKPPVQSESPSKKASVGSAASKPSSRAPSKTKNTFGNIYGDEEEEKPRSKSKPKYNLDIDIGLDDVPAETKPQFKATDFDFL